MILGFDIGNTNTTLGLYERESVSPVESYRFNTIRGMTGDELALTLGGFIALHEKKTGNAVTVDGAVFSSVVTELAPAYHLAFSRHFAIEPLEISSKCRLAISIRYDDPSQLGVDRIVNAEAVFSEYGGNAIIVDLGTATTFCILLEGGAFDGGIIAPGAGVAIQALASRTSKLMAVNFEKPDDLIATNTADAITSGFFFGTVAMVEGIVRRIAARYGKEFRVYITGGFSDAISPHLEFEHVVDPLLTMKGIKIIYDRNR